MEIKNQAFEHNSSLKEIIIPNNVTKIGASAFTYCSAMTNVVLGSSVQTIEGTAFRLCGRIPTLVLPASLEVIGAKAFEYCNTLKDVTFEGKDIATMQGLTNYPWSLPSGCVIHCTDGDTTLP